MSRQQIQGIGIDIIEIERIRRISLQWRAV